MQCQRAKLGGVAQAVWKRNVGRQFTFHLVGHQAEQRRVEGARRNGVATYSAAREIAGNDQSHCHHAALRSAVSHLPYLPVVGSDRGRVDDYTALTVFVGVVVEHARGCQARYVESAHQVDLDGKLEVLERHRALFASGASGGAYARAVDAGVDRAESLGRGIDSRLHLLLVGYVGRREDSVLAQSLGHGHAVGAVEIKQRHAAARFEYFFGRRQAQARGSAGYNRYYIPRLHRCSPLAC